MQYIPSEIAVCRHSNSVASDPEQCTSAKNTGPLPWPYTEPVVVVVTTAPVYKAVQHNYGNVLI